MPLLKGKKAETKKGFSKNVSTEVKAGKPVKQAVAIAYDLKRDGNVKNESFDELINQYLNHYLFEDVTTITPPSSAEIAKLGKTIQDKKKKELVASTNPSNLAKLATELKKAGITSDSLA